MHSDGQPEVARTVNSTSEEDSEERGIDDSEGGGPGIDQVRHTEERSGSKNGGPSAVAAHEELEWEATESDLLPHGSAKKEDGHEEGGAPGDVRVCDPFKRGKSEGNGGENDECRRSRSQSNSGEQVAAGAGEPVETEVREAAGLVDRHAEGVPQGGGQQQGYRESDHFAGDGAADRGEDLGQDPGHEDAGGSAQQGPQWIASSCRSRFRHGQAWLEAAVLAGVDLVTLT